MKTHSLRTRILIPLMLAIGVLLGAFILSFYRFQQRHLTNEVGSRLASVEELFVELLAHDAGMMGATLKAILFDEQLKSALKAKDRSALLELTQTLFRELNSGHRITHFYFTGPDRVNILRVHKPERYGDRINRLTTLEAEKTRKLSHGIELGPLGTFTLRVVEPLYDGKELIGYVELGEEIHHIIRELKEILGIEIYVVIEKKHLDRANWESGMQMLGREAIWERFPTVVMIDYTLDVFPERLAGFLDKERLPSTKTDDVDVSLNDRRYRSRFFHMRDAGGYGVGDMVVMMDITGRVADIHDTIFVIGGSCLVLGGILFTFFYLFVGPVKRQMETASQDVVRVSKAVESTSDAVIMLDSSGQPMYQNKASGELFGYTIEELKTGEELSILYTDPMVAHEVFDTLTEGKACRREAEMRTRTGSIKLVSLRADTIKGEKGETVGFICIYTDITERKRADLTLRQSEAKFRNLSTELDLGLSEVFGALNQISSGNPEVRIPEASEIELITKLKHTVNVTAENLGEIVDLSHEFAIGLAEHFDTLHRVSKGDLTARVSGSSPVELMESLKKITNEMIESVSGEITERKRAEEALKEYSERLEERVEERTKELREAQEQLVRREKLATLGQLAGGLGHELRNPLGAIKNVIYLLNMVLEDPQPEVKETLEIIEKEVGISEGVITSLLDFARPKPPTRHIVDINKVLQEALSRIHVPENVEVVGQFSETLPTILADPDQLTQVFGNLILNAVQAMPKRGQLTIKSEAPSPEFLTVSFIDTGIGMDEETLGKAFEPLFTIKSKGIGLGLALSKMLVEAHGGTIEVQSAVGKGTTFRVKLPLDD